MAVEKDTQIAHSNIETAQEASQIAESPRINTAEKAIGSINYSEMEQSRAVPMANPQQLDPELAMDYQLGATGGISHGKALLLDYDPLVQ